MGNDDSWTPEEIARASERQKEASEAAERKKVLLETKVSKEISQSNQKQVIVKTYKGSQEHPLPQNSAAASSAASAYLGLGVLVSAFGFALLFTDNPSFEYKVGTAFGQLFVTSIFTLPLFLIWRFATKPGRVARLARAFNVFCLLLVLLWFMLFVLAKNLLPSFIA